MYSDTITIFNRYHSPSGDMWYPHILRNVNLIVDKASIMARYGAETTDKASLHVKYSYGLDKSIRIDGTRYLPPKEWAQLLNDKLKNCITFNSDSNYFDFFIVGEYKSKQPIADSDYLEGFFAEMEDKTECYVLTGVSSPYKIIPHFEITAR